MKQIVVPILIAFSFSFVLLQSSGSEKIAWSPDRKLTWDDFKGKPTGTSDAYTCYEISCKPKTTEANVEFYISTTFVKNKSMVKVGKNSDYLLGHEQAHFDIGELFSRKLREKMSKTKFHLKTLASESKKIQSENFNDCKAYQREYDTETDHSKVEDKQSEWEAKIGKELTKMEAYKDTIVKAALKR